MKKQTTKVREDQQSPIVEKVDSKSLELTKKTTGHKQELVQVLHDGSDTPADAQECELEDVQITTVESIHDHEITFVNGKHSYTINKDLLPPEMYARLKPGDLFPLSNTGTIDEVWAAFFELYNTGIKPHLTVSAGDNEFVVNEGFISHYSNNNPVIWTNKRFNAVGANYFKEGFIPKIGQQVFFSFGKGKNIQEFTVFSAPYTLLTKKGNPVVIDAVNQKRKEVQHNAMLLKSKKNTPPEQHIPSSAQPEGKHTVQPHTPPQGLERNDIDNIKSKALGAKSQQVAMALAYQARTQNETMDALTYAHLPEARMQDLHIGTKVVSKKGTPGIIKKIPSKDNNLGKNTIIVSFYWIDDAGKKHTDEAKTKIGDFKCVREPEKYIPKRERQEGQHHQGKQETHTSHEPKKPSSSNDKDIYASLPETKISDLKQGDTILTNNGIHALVKTLPGKGVQLSRTNIIASVLYLNEKNEKKYTTTKLAQGEFKAIKNTNYERLINKTQAQSDQAKEQKHTRKSHDKEKNPSK